MAASTSVASRGSRSPWHRKGRTLGRVSERRALVISAHPDDIEFGCAGTMCTWVDEGWDVRYVIVTSGQKGVQDARRGRHRRGFVQGSRPGSERHPLNQDGVVQRAGIGLTPIFAALLSCDLRQRKTLAFLGGF